MRRLTLVIAIAGCGNPHDATPDAAPDVAIDAPAAPVFRDPLSLPEPELATEALKILGALNGTRPQCESCHDMTRQRLRYWRALSDTAMTSCLTDLAVSSQESARK